MRVIALKSPRAPCGPPFLPEHAALSRRSKITRNYAQREPHLYNGAALSARKDRVSGNIIFNRRTHRHVTRAEQYPGGGRGPPQRWNARSGQYIPFE